MRLTEKWTLANGVTVLYRRDPLFPLTSATLLLRAGSRGELPREAGLCSMSMDLLMQGTKRRNARQIARVMESVGASMGTQAHEDYAELGFVVPSAELDRALDLMAEVLEEPSFPREEITKEKSHVLASLGSRRDAIFNVAYDELNKKLYGPHPYGRPLEGRAETIRGFGRSDFQAWHRRQIRPDQAILSIISPHPEPIILARLEKTIGSWRAEKAPLERPATAPPIRLLKSSLSVDVKSSFEQAYLMVGWQVPGAAHRDQVSLKVLNAVLGGGMSSRLFVTLREKLGLAYEVSSFYPTRLDGSQWVIYLGLPAEKLGTALKKLHELLRGLAERGPTALEADQAKAMIRGAFLMDRQSRRRQAWYTAWWEFLGRGPLFGDEFLNAIDAVTVQELHELIRRLYAQPRVTVTVVPKAKARGQQ